MGKQVATSREYGLPVVEIGQDALIRAVKLAIVDLRRTRQYVSTSTVAQCVYGDLRMATPKRVFVGRCMVYAVLLDLGVKRMTKKGKTFWIVGKPR